MGTYTDSENTRSRILAVAGETFARRGFQAATIRDICSAAEVNLASVNYYFGDKQQLYVAALEHARDTQQSKFPFVEFLTSGEPADRLRNFIGVLVQRLGVGMPTSGRWEIQLLVRELMRPGPAGRGIVEDFFRPYFQLLMDILQQLAPRPLSRSECLRLGFSVIGQCLFYRVAEPIIAMLVDLESQPAVLNTSEVVEHITRFTLSGIGAIGQGCRHSDEPLTT